jgi:hypothetical protein
MRTHPAGIAAMVAVLLSSPAALATGSGADVCLEVAPEAVTPAEWSTVVEAVGEAVTARPALFPAPSLRVEEGRLDIASGHEGTPSEAGPCLVPGYGWTARFDRTFLDAGADRMLADAPTTPGIDSEVHIEWYPDEARLRTVLVFAGPLDIPNGTCWVDDALAVADGAVTASGDQGLRTSPFAEGACGRFFDHLPDGGAGEQAATLLPAVVELGDGTALRFVAEDVLVQEEAVLVSGRLARD